MEVVGHMSWQQGKKRNPDPRVDPFIRDTAHQATPKNRDSVRATPTPKNGTVFVRLQKIETMAIVVQKMETMFVRLQKIASIAIVVRKNPEILSQQLSKRYNASSIEHYSNLEPFEPEYIVYCII